MNRAEKKVSIIAPIFMYYPAIVPSLLAQTHSNWELLLIHDGPHPKVLEEHLNSYQDLRIRFSYTENRYNDWGHSLRPIGLEAATGDYIVHTNADNYLTPLYCERMLSEFYPDSDTSDDLDRNLIGVYCDCLHNYIDYRGLNCSLEFSSIDCGCVMWKAPIAKELGWPSRDEASDWVLIEKAIQQYGREAFAHVSQYLFVHN